jgi:hypothetical protein
MKTYLDNNIAAYALICTNWAMDDKTKYPKTWRKWKEDAKRAGALLVACKPENYTDKDYIG